MGNSVNLTGGHLVFGKGLDEHGEVSTLKQPPFTTPALKAAAGATHSLAFLNTGELYAWGFNQHCQLGLPKQKATLAKVELGNKVVVSLAAGAFHSAAVSDDGHLFMWGRGTEGQLGRKVPHKSSRKSTATPTLVAFFRDTSVMSVACGYDFTIVTTCNYQVFSFGNGTTGALGTGKLKNSHKPRHLTSLKEEIVVKVACGVRHCVACTITGKVYTWGSPYAKILPSFPIVATPTQVEQLSHLKVIDVACGNTHSGVLVERPKTIVTWGGNQFGQLGYETKEEVSLEPRMVNIAGQVEAIGAGYDFSVALLETEEVLGWGDNSEHQLCRQRLVVNKPTVISRGIKVKAVQCGYWHTLFLGDKVPSPNNVGEQSVYLTEDPSPSRALSYSYTS